MNETTWQACTDPLALLHHHEQELSERRLRLFACACTRRVWPLLTREPVRAAVGTAERFADGLAGRDDLRAGWLAVRKALGTAPLGTHWEHALMAALNATTEPMTRHRAGDAARYAALALDADWQSGAPIDKEADDRRRSGSPAERALQCRLVRDLVPPPHAAIDPAWRAWEGGQVLALARAVRAEQDWGDMPVLADALEEAGCRDEAVLGHCRGGGPHTLACWVLELLLRPGLSGRP
jgi:hypothetical protein